MTKLQPNTFYLKRDKAGNSKIIKTTKSGRISTSRHPYSLDGELINGCLIAYERFNNYVDPFKPTYRTKYTGQYLIVYGEHSSGDLITNAGLFPKYSIKLSQPFPEYI